MVARRTDFRSTEQASLPLPHLPRFSKERPASFQAQTKSYTSTSEPPTPPSSFTAARTASPPEMTSRGKRASAWLSSAKAGLKQLSTGSTVTSTSSSSSTDAGAGAGGSGGATAGAGASGVGNGAATKGKERAAEQDDAGAAEVLAMPTIAPRQIIGAVEDEWPLYRYVLALPCLRPGLD